MLLDEARKQKKYEFNQVQKKINDLIIECESMYVSLLKYNDLITYEELYTLTQDDKNNFIRIRDRAHDMEHLLLHYKDELISLIEGDVEWFLTDEDVATNKNYFNEYYNSDIFFNYFRAEIDLSLLFDKLKQLNIPRKTEFNHNLHVHHGGGCC